MILRSNRGKNFPLRLLCVAIDAKPLQIIKVVASALRSRRDVVALACLCDDPAALACELVSQLNLINKATPRSASTTLPVVIR